MSTKPAEITCDQCGKDITYTSNCYDYRVVLGDESMPHDPKGNGSVTDVAAYRAFDSPRHFCDGRCFWLWARAGIERKDKAKAEEAALWEAARVAGSDTITLHGQRITRPGWVIRPQAAP